jgi:hypothetical protein
MTQGATFTFDQDKLGFKPFAEKLEKFLMVAHDFIEGSLVVSLNAPFGSGKSTFLSMWKADLDADQAPRPKAIMLNAWESDYCGDPLLSVLGGLIGSCGPDDAIQVKALREACKDVASFATGLVNNVVAKWSGIDALAAGKFAEEKKKARRSPKPDSLANYEHRTEALKRLKVALRKVFGGQCPKAFVFVDELDRCRPDYAISYLETIKHVFDVHGLVFVLAVDLGQLESSAKALFGQGLNFQEYFRKFVQRQFALPPPSKEGFYALADHYTRTYIVKAGQRFSRLGLDGFVPNITELVANLGATPRQIQEIFRIIGHSAGSDEQTGVYNNWGWGVALVLLSTLKVLNQDLYKAIGRRESVGQDVGGYLLKSIKVERVKWWMCVYLTGTHDHQVTSHPSPQTVLVTLGFGLTEADTIKDVHSHISAWGNSLSDGVWRAHSKIESAELI